jgi:hypothetical protein
MEDKRNTDFKWDLFCRTQNWKKKEETKPHIRNRNASWQEHHPDIPLKLWNPAKLY